MAIRISLSQTESRLFCCSKWWGDPDMPKDMQYPMMTDDNGEEYPLTFVCQIDCADIAELDTEGLLPKEGMLYFFAALDEYLGYDVPFHNGIGELPKGAVKVKYTKQVNPETFESYIMVDEDDEPLAMPALKMEFSQCGDQEDDLKILGQPFSADARDAFPGFVSLLQIDSEGDTIEGLRLYDCGLLNILISPEHLKAGNWKRCLGFMTSM